MPHAFPEWQGAKLLGALAQGMYWFLILRADLAAKRGEIEAIKGLRIGAAPLVDLGLKRHLVQSGIDFERDGVDIGPVPGAFTGNSKNFGVAAAKSLEDGKVDGFWANGMRAEVAVRRGVGTMVIDARRGAGPADAFNYTMPALITSELLIRDNPNAAAAALIALVKTQRALKADISLATKVGRALLPADAAEMIADVVARDLPYYTPVVTQDFVAGMSAFSKAMGLTTRDLSYDQVVATQFSNLWEA